MPEVDPEEDVVPGESIDEWAERQDEREREAESQQARSVVQERRDDPLFDPEDWDPWLGAL